MGSHINPLTPPVIEKAPYPTERFPIPHTFLYALVRLFLSHRVTELDYSEWSVSSFLGWQVEVQHEVFDGFVLLIEDDSGVLLTDVGALLTKEDILL